MGNCGLRANIFSRIIKAATFFFIEESRAALVTTLLFCRLICEAMSPFFSYRAAGNEDGDEVKTSNQDEATSSIYYYSSLAFTIHRHLLPW